MVTHICNKFDYVIFRREEDYSLFLNRLSVVSENCNVSILAITIMSNHFHIIAKGDNYPLFLSKLMQVYTQC